MKGLRLHLLKKKHKLSPREIKFLIVFAASGFQDYESAYREYRQDDPENDPSKLRNKGSVIYSHIRDKMGDQFSEYLEAVGLGTDRLAYEIEQGLNACKVKFYEGKIISDIDGNPIVLEDNTTRQKARELLADLHGARIKKVQVSGDKIGALLDAFQGIADGGDDG